MVNEPPDSIVKSPRIAPECIRIEASDPRSDNRLRFVDVSPDAVTIRRAVAGVSMAIRMKSHAYRGVALRIAGLADGRFRYEVRLAHRDPDLAVPLGEGEDLAAMEAQWREWAAFFRLPALAGRKEGVDMPVNVAGAELTRRTPNARRRGDALALRRPRFLRRRALGRALGGWVVEKPRTVFYDS